MRRVALVQRQIDFWLLGGLSMLVLILLPFTSLQTGALALWAPIWLPLIDFPHFMASYKLAYGRERQFLRTHWVALIVVPIAMLLSLTWGFMVAPAILDTLANLIFFAFGWHRARQVYGCMYIYGQYDGYFLSRGQARVLNALTYAIWCGGLLHIMAYPKPMSFYGLNLWRIEVPTLALKACTAVVLTLSFAFAGILIQRLVTKRQWPSACFLIPLIAYVGWTISYLVNFEYFIYLTPTFHSLQYLACVYGYERPNINSAIKVIMGYLALVLTGYLAFRGVPTALQSQVPQALAISYIFFSLHHYLMDSLVWRGTDVVFRERLLSPIVSRAVSV